LEASPRKSCSPGCSPIFGSTPLIMALPGWDERVKGHSPSGAFPSLI